MTHQLVISLRRSLKSELDWFYYLRKLLLSQSNPTKMSKLGKLIDETSSFYTLSSDFTITQLVSNYS